MQIKVLSWNIWFDGFFKEIVPFLLDANADVIGLQEVVSDDQTRDVINFLKTRGYFYVFAPVSKLIKDGRTFGNAIFSKQRILSSKIHTLSEIESRNAVEAEIEVGKSVLHVFSTHLLHTHQQPSEIQTLQAENLIKSISPTNCIVTGDFNAKPDSIAIEKMNAVMTDTDPSSQPTWSVHPAGCLKCNPQKVDMRLDYIFVSKDMPFSNFQVHNSKASDHLPISVTIEV